MTAPQPATVEDVTRFLARAGGSLTHFRYFAKRPVETVRNHLLTLISADRGGEPMAYGHLDPEDGVVWLGICVAETERGKGHGTMMLQALLDAARKQNLPAVRLSVDQENLPAIRLYQAHGFRRIGGTGGVEFYEWNA